MTNRQCLTIALCVSLSLFTSQANAWAADALKTSCQSGDQLEHMRCKLYVEGFIDGALITDPTVADAVLEDAPELSAWMRRAIRTRVGDKMNRYGDSFYASFCLPEGDAVEHVVNKIKDTEIDMAQDMPASYWIYQLLRQEFPCDEPVR